MKLKLVESQYKVYEFIEEHNHKLHTVETSHMLRSQRRISEVQGYEIELAKDSGLRQKTSFDLMSLHMGGRENVGYTRTDVKNYLKSRRQRNMAYGEAGALLQYFHNQTLENPSFFHAYQMDCDEQITNVFLADAKMLIDYDHFGDVVSLDTTFGTNKNNRPLALFCGFNHHRGIVIFGAALILDETADSFIWLFRTFLEAQRQKKPLTIFTYQDAAMVRALSEVMPDTVHGLCTWHLMRNATKHLAHFLRGVSYILSDISRCVYEIETEDDFEIAWCKMMIEHNVGDNQWLTTTYRIRKKWAACYMKKSFTLGIRSTQLSESLNSDLKDSLNPKLDLVQFFKHFERIVDDKRYNELKCEYEQREKLPLVRNKESPILMQVSTIYTRAIFDMFHIEHDKVGRAYIKEKNESQSLFQYVISLINVGTEYRVSFYPSSNNITCSCRKFENIGILCSHALKIYERNDVKVVPDQYILPRWTKKVRARVVYDVRGKKIEEDPRRDMTNRYTDLTRKLVSLATEAARSEEACSELKKFAFELKQKFCEFHSTGKGMDANLSATAVPTPQASGFRQKEGPQNKRRHKSCVEVQ